MQNHILLCDSGRAAHCVLLACFIASSGGLFNLIHWPELLPFLAQASAAPLLGAAWAAVSGAELDEGRDGCEWANGAVWDSMLLPFTVMETHFPMKTNAHMSLINSCRLRAVHVSVTGVRAAVLRLQPRQRQPDPVSRGGDGLQQRRHPSDRQQRGSQLVAGEPPSRYFLKMTWHLWAAACWSVICARPVMWWVEPRGWSPVSSWRRRGKRLSLGTLMDQVCFVCE